MSSTIQKPEHNRHDNIWELRRAREYPSKEQIWEATEKFRLVDIAGDHVDQIGGAILFRRVEDFIYSVLHKHKVKLPIWKIVIPRLDGKTGAIYYVAECDDYNRIFRGTYGYGGTGPHESALIEASFEKHSLFFEVRDGDYLIDFLREKESVSE